MGREGRLGKLGSKREKGGEWGECAGEGARRRSVTSKGDLEHSEGKVGKKRV